MEYDMEKAGRMWDQYVGGQGPEEFMQLSKTSDVREAVSEYMDELDNMFGAGAAVNAPEDLEDALVAYIEGME